MSWKYDIYGTWGRQRFLVNYPGSALRNQSMVSQPSPVVRPSWAKSFSLYRERRGDAHLLPLVRGRIHLTT